MSDYTYYDKANNTYYVNPNKYISELYADIMPQNVIEDIQKDICNSIEFKQIQLSLLKGCEYNKQDSLCSVPNGSINSDVMIINKSPNEFEQTVTSSMLSPNNYLIPYLIKYMKLDYYCTDILKCNSCNNVNYCIEKYFLKELEIVNPKIIIFNGIESYNLIKDKNIKLFSNMPKDVYYGNIYKVDNRTNVIIVYDTSKIFDNDKEMSSKMKNELWNQLSKIRNVLEVK